ncbi:hypothetical protein [Pedococcus soli]
MSSPLLTLADVAARLSIHPETAALWMRTGHLSAHNLSSGKRSRADLRHRLREVLTMRWVLLVAGLALIGWWAWDRARG